MYCRSVFHKSLAFHCTLLVSNKSNFTHLFTLVCIPSYNLSPYWHPNKKSLKVLEGEKIFFPFWWVISKKGKKGGNKIFKSGGEGDEKGGGGPRFLEKIEGGNRPTLWTVFYPKKL